MKEKPVIVEAMYFGKLPVFSRGQWFKWKAYRDTKAAQMAIDSCSRRHKHFEFRIRDSKPLVTDK